MKTKEEILKQISEEDIINAIKEYENTKKGIYPKGEEWKGLRKDRENMKVLTDLILRYNKQNEDLK